MFGMLPSLALRRKHERIFCRFSLAQNFYETRISIEFARERKGKYLNDRRTFGHQTVVILGQDYIEFLASSQFGVTLGRHALVVLFQAIEDLVKVWLSAHRTKRSARLTCALPGD